MLVQFGLLQNDAAMLLERTEEASTDELLTKIAEIEVNAVEPAFPAPSARGAGKSRGIIA